MSDEKRYPRGDVEGQGLTEEVKRHLEELDKGEEAEDPQELGNIPQECKESLQPQPDPPDAPSPASQPLEAQRLITRAQIIALHYLTAILEDPKKLADISPTTLLNIIAQLEDMRLTEIWTRKLEKAILSKPSMLQPPNAKGMHLQKLKGLSGRVKAAKLPDRREGPSKLFEDLPSDE